MNSIGVSNRAFADGHVNLDWVIQLDWLPDETLYSWCVRYHQTAGSSTWTRTKQLLFSGRPVGISHEVPGNVERLVGRTRGMLGDAGTILTKRTIFPVLIRFQPRFHVEQAIAEVLTAHRLNKSRLGLTSGLFPANFPLKACRACMERDECLYQIAYWHREHQLPGVWICSTHGTLLDEASTPHRPSGGSNAVLPRFATFIDRPHHSDDSVLSGKGHALTKLAATVFELAVLPMNQFFSPREVLHAHLATMARTGLTESTSGRESAIQSYLAHCRELGFVQELSRAPQTAGDALNSIHTLLSPRTCVRHPLHQMVFISWLYESGRNFLHELNRQSCLRGQGKAEIHDLYLAGMISSETAQQLQTGQISMRQAARRTGVSVADLHTSASNLGLAIKEQPRLPDASLYSAVVDALAKGLNKKDIASTSGVSAKMIALMILQEPHLQEQWLAARFLSAREKARTWWNMAIKFSPGARVSAIRRMNPAASDWLRRNDLHWLLAHSPDSRSPSASHNHRWDIDDELARQVREVALQIRLAEGSHSRIRLSMLRKHIPELQMHRCAIANLPLTSRAISDVTAPPKTEGPIFSADRSRD